VGHFRVTARGGGAIALDLQRRSGIDIDTAGTQGHAAQANVDGAGGGGQNHAVVVIGEMLGLKAPAVDRLFKIAHYGKAQRGQPGGQPVHHRPGLGRDRLESALHQGGRLRRLARKARRIFSHAEKHRAGRPQAQRRADGVAGQHTKHMAVRGQYRVFDDMAHDLAARQVIGIDLLPIGQVLAGLLFVTGFQRMADTGEMVAELAKAQRHIQHQHMPGHRQRPAHQCDQQPMHSHGQGRGQQHRDAPGQPAVALLASIEVAAEPLHPGPHAGIDRIVTRQGLGLLQQQGHQRGEKTHGQ